MRNLILFPLAAAFLILAILGGSHTATAQAQATLAGTVTVNGEAAPADVGLVAVLADGTECGDTVTKVGGTFTMSLTRECAGKPVFFRLAVTEDQTTTPATIEAGAQTVDIAFEGLSDESLQAIGAGPTTVEEKAQEAVKEALEEEGAPVALITGDSLLVVVLFISVGGMALLGSMVFLKAVETCLRARRKAGGGEEQTAPDKEAELTYRRQVEGMVLIMVIVALILLGLSEKISDEGVISVLAAVVGYTVGRAVAVGT